LDWLVSVSTYNPPQDAKKGCCGFPQSYLFEQLSLQLLPVIANRWLTGEKLEMSASAVSAAVPASSSSGSTPRATRPPHQRPTTYTGPSSSASQPSSSHSSNGPPIPPPPRTSSKTQVPSVSPTSGNKGNTRGGDGQHDRERNERDRDRERADRERRKMEDGKARQEQPVGRANSTRVSRAASHSNSAPQPVDRQTSSRRRQDTESSGKSRAGHMHATNNNGEETRRTTRKETRFGEYVLGQTLGEGEFGKVKLGWRRDGGVQVSFLILKFSLSFFFFFPSLFSPHGLLEILMRIKVAIKLIRRDSVSPHPNRLSKIYREIAILRTLSHPNIVRLHEMVETDRHIGIILEYASGGELFDYILTHRYLKDPPACRLFAQLVSGVGYLHKKGIVHRDLKLENLLLDRNRNIIITDFGFANVFDPTDELGELEDRMNDPTIIKELEKGVPHTDRKPDGSSLLSIIGPGQTRRRGDLMATSCGSPCYAAPELVVSDGLYTGRKVDVWSCGVILVRVVGCRDV
jgi:protein-serine/threonine kinase